MLRCRPLRPSRLCRSSHHPPTSPARRAGDRLRQGALHASTNTGSRCATGSGSSPRSTSPRTRLSAIRSCCAGPRTASQPYGADAYKVGSRPFGALRQGRLHRRLPGRARALDVGRRVRQHAAAPADRRRVPTTSTRARDTYDTIDWLIKHVPDHNGQVGMWGISYPGLLHGRRDDRRPSGAQGRVAPGAGDRLVHRRRLASQRRVPPAARLQLPRWLRPPAARADQARCRAFRITAHPTATTSFSGWARSPTPTAAISRTTWRSGTRSCSTAPTTSSGRPAIFGRISKNIKPAVMTVGGWFDAENLFGALETYKKVEATSPGRDQRAGDGALASRRLEPRRRLDARPDPVQFQDRPSSSASRSSSRSSSII